MTTTATLSEQASRLYGQDRRIQRSQKAWDEVGPGREEVEGVPVVWKPSPGPQTMFLESNAREVLMGGAVFGGKSDALIAGALRWVYHPDHSAILLRREKEDLRETIDRAKELYGAVCPSAQWVESRSRFEFPSGASILCGAAQHEKDIEAYKSFEFNYIGFDELTTFTKKQYVYMLSRNRGKKRSGLPTFMRGGTNPDGPGHDWVFKRFVRDRLPYVVYDYPYEVERPDGTTLRTSLTRQFIPSTVFDNPHAGDLEGYIAGLRSMGKHLADALLYGKWDYFRGQMFPYTLQEVSPGLAMEGHYVVRCMDYGWSDPSVVYWLVVYPREGKRALVDVAGELVLQETNVDSLAYMIQKREEDLQVTYGLSSPRLSVIDPSTGKSEGTSGGQNIRDMIQAAGVWFTNANNDRQSGWAQVRRFLETDRLRIWEGQAPYLTESLPKLVRDPRKADDLRKNQDDHGADTLRYGLMAIADFEGFTLTEGPGEVADEGERRRDPYFSQVMAALQRPRQMGSLEGLGPGF